MPIAPNYKYIKIPNDAKTIYEILNRSNVRIKVLENGDSGMCLIEPDVLYLRAEL
jgi:hypothetical protein